MTWKASINNHSFERDFEKSMKMESAICIICLLVVIIVSDFVTCPSRGFQFHIGLGVSFNMKVLTCKFKFVRYRDGAAGGYCVSVGTTNSAHHVACLYLLMYFLGKISCWVR